MYFLFFLHRQNTSIYVYIYLHYLNIFFSHRQYLTTLSTVCVCIMCAPYLIVTAKHSLITFLLLSLLHPGYLRLCYMDIVCILPAWFFQSIFDILLLCFCFCFFCLFRAAPAAYGGSQTRGSIRAVATDLHHRHSGSELHLRPTLRLMAMLDP